MESRLRELQERMGWTDETLFDLLLTHATDATVEVIESIAAEEREAAEEEPESEECPDCGSDCGVPGTEDYGCPVCSRAAAREDEARYGDD